MPNKGYFIQQMTRRGAGTLFDEGRGKDKVVISNVNNFLAKKAACSRKRAAQKNSFFMYYRLSKSHSCWPYRSRFAEVPLLSLALIKHKVRPTSQTI